MIVNWAIKQVGGAFRYGPDMMEAGLSGGARRLVAAAFRDIDSARLVDYHTHIMGLGTGGTGNFVNPAMRSRRRIAKHLKFSVYASAIGIATLENADREAVTRLVDLIRHIKGHGRYCLLAFDKNYDPGGRPDLERTEFYVPNEYVFALAGEFPDCFIPVISVNPYRPDALEELERWAEAGSRLVKWLPNAMGINPSDPKCDRFYEKLIERDLALLTHGGEEKAVDSKEAQKLGNPLLLRRPLDAGVKVIVAHCAGLGTNRDLESPGGETVPNFDLLLRLMDDGRYRANLFADISAMTQWNRIGAPLTTVIRRADLHPRLMNGSDYPLPAVNVVISTRALARAGYINAAERAALNEIYHYNPLLFDFVLKRTMRAPGTGEQLPASVFMVNPAVVV